MFGTSGIRGLYGKEVTGELALKIGNLSAGETTVIGRDIRGSGKVLSLALVSGVLSKGKDAIDIGIVPTPTLALACKNLNCNGIMVTASHNPPEYNGLKLFSKGLEISRETEEKITKAYCENRISFCNWNKTGVVRIYENAVLEHKNLIKKLIDLKLIQAKKPKVVLDCNGPASVIAPKLMEEIGCRVVSIHTSLEKFERPSEPNSKNLLILSKRVVEESADFGIGYDGDADRAVIVDEKGVVFPLDVQLAAIIENEMKKNKTPAKKIITTIEASLIVKKTIEKAGALPIITPVGSLFVSKALQKENAVFGGEPCGEYIFKDGVCSPDGILTGAKFAEIFCMQKKLSELREKYPCYPMVREKFECDNSKKYKIIEKIKKDAKFVGSIRDDDGIRIDQQDGWFLIRASGTEPFIRMTMEYLEKTRLEKMAADIRKIILSNLE